MSSDKKIKKHAPVHIILKRARKYYGVMTIEQGDDDSVYIKPYFHNKNTSKVGDRHIDDIYLSVHKSGVMHFKGFEKKRKTDAIDRNSALPFNKIDGVHLVADYICAKTDNLRQLSNPANLSGINWVELSSNPDRLPVTGLIAPSYIIFDYDEYISKNKSVVISVGITPKNYESSVNSHLVSNMPGYKTCAHSGSLAADKDIIYIFREARGITNNSIIVSQYDGTIKIARISH